MITGLVKRRAQLAGFSGLPGARFLVPTTNAFTPFTRPVFVALNDPSRPLQNASRSEGGTLSLTLNANFNDWRVTLGGKYDERRRTFAFDQLGTIPGGFITVDNAVNPFAGTLATSIPVSTRTTRSTTIVREMSFSSLSAVVASSFERFISSEFASSRKSWPSWSSKAWIERGSLASARWAGSPPDTRTTSEIGEGKHLTGCGREG